MPRSDGSAEFKEKTKHFKGKPCEPFHKQNLRALTKRCGRYLITRKTETQEEGGLQAELLASREGECQGKRLCAHRERQEELF